MERIDGRVVYTNPWMTVREDSVRRVDGSTGIYGYVDKPDFALVMPRADAGFWLVEQFRYTIGRRVWEFPQGGWPTGSSGTPVELARAELAEETGLRAGTLTNLGHLQEAYGHSTQGFDVFLAEDLTAGEPDREVTELDMVHRFFPDDAVKALVRSGDLVDSATLAALSLWRIVGP